MTSAKLTPMLEQYLSIKEEYPEALLFFRMGDFYEMFFEDARQASQALDIALTTRNKSDPDPIPMCGVPHHSADSYIARLIAQGFKVAVCDQTEDPGQAKGLVRREVVRVVTPGMTLDDASLDKKSENLVGCVCRVKDRWGLSVMDISTGSFRATETSDPAMLLSEAARLAPAEMILPESFSRDPEAADIVAWAEPLAHTSTEDAGFDPARAARTLSEHFATHNLEGFGLGEARAATAAAGALLEYVADTQKQKADHVTGIEVYNLGDFLWLDDTTCRNLELFSQIRTGGRAQSLVSVIDSTVTAMGGRLFARWLRYPLKDVDSICERADAVAEARHRLSDRNRVRELLARVQDVARIRGRLVMGAANARDLLALKASLAVLPEVFGLVAGFSSPILAHGVTEDDLSDIHTLLESAIAEDAPPTIKDGGIIKPGFNDELDELMTLASDAKSWLVRLEAREKEQTGISNLKVRYNKVFGYYIEVPKSRAEQVPEYYVRKQTLVNAERYITAELKEFEDRVLGAEEKKTVLEYTLFLEIRNRLLAEDARIAAAADHLARVDVLFGLAETADQNGYVRPVMEGPGRIVIEEGRHPVVEKMLAGRRYVPNSVALDNDENQVLIITGPNMAGKSTVLRQVALCVILAQMGGFVPAEAAVIGVVDRIFTRVGALDNLAAGQSTFMVEMQETANILNNATAESLVVIDEIGRGTSTFDGLSIAWAVAEYLHDKGGHGVKTLFATHYHELTDLEKTHPRVANFNIAVREWNDQVFFLHKLVPGGTNKSYGIAVARLAGVPSFVVQRAKEVLSQIEDQSQTRGLTAGPGKVREAPVQMSLFPTPADKVARVLEGLSIETMTPVQALNMLDELKARICGALPEGENEGPEQ